MSGVTPTSYKNQSFLGIALDQYKAIDDLIENSVKKPIVNCIKTGGSYQMIAEAANSMQKLQAGDVPEEYRDLLGNTLCAGLQNSIKGAIEDIKPILQSVPLTIDLKSQKVEGGSLYDALFPTPQTKVSLRLNGLDWNSVSTATRSGRVEVPNAEEKARADAFNKGTYLPWLDKNIDEILTSPKTSIQEEDDYVNYVFKKTFIYEGVTITQITTRRTDCHHTEGIHINVSIKTLLDYSPCVSIQAHPNLEPDLELAFSRNF